ncbi:MAG: stage IV sporulation protein A [Clostridia bacterium]|nr:stage IV sporulation protein A [Clostridia bacterium]
MKNFNVYEDIVERTNGDIYLGVVGPVRCGKSTFISKFMEKFVLPKISNVHAYERALDELPQSADGKTIMTTQPKFVPNEAVNIEISDKLNMNVRLIDCVGYMVDGAIGDMEEDKPRMVKTPWSNKEIPFNEAGRIGTKKVITDHSTIAVLMTTDGTISDIDRKSYEKAEAEVAEELLRSGKPFVIAINTTNKNSKEVKKLQEELQAKYKVPTLVLNVVELNEEDVEEIFTNILTEFPVTSIKIKMPLWLQAMPFENEIIQEIVSEVLASVDGVEKVGDFSYDKVLFMDNADFEPLVLNSIDMGEGKLVFEITPKPELFYAILSKECGVIIKNDFELIASLRELNIAKREYDKIKNAMRDVEEFGYGVVKPNLEDMQIEEPKLIKQGNKSGVKFKATASSLHIMKVDIEAEVNPTVGSEEQSADLANSLIAKYQENPASILDTNIFGKSLQELLQDNVSGKLNQMPVDVQKKLRKTLSRVVNEGKGGIICILL